MLKGLYTRCYLDPKPNSLPPSIPPYISSSIHPSILTSIPHQSSLCPTSISPSIPSGEENTRECPRDKEKFDEKARIKISCSCLFNLIF